MTEAWGYFALGLLLLALGGDSIVKGASGLAQRIGASPFVAGLLLIQALAQSFHAFPVEAEPFAFLRAAQPQVWGAEIFQAGLWVALPLITLLLFVNLSLGVVSRVAPQLNVFAVGFPLTVSVGLLGLAATLPLMETPLQAVLQRLLSGFT